MIGKLQNLLREARSEIIGGLVVLAVGTFAGMLIAGKGLKVAFLATLPIVVILVFVLWLYTRLEELQPSRPTPKPPRRREPRFIDRHDREGRDLVKRVSETLGANGLVTVWGAGGVGKTTLAIEVAHRLCPKPYSGGVIWDTADARPDFMLVTLLDRILTDLEREEARTLALDAKADLADRLLTEAMPCLLGLDNLETIAEEEQTAVIAFLDELSCPVLVTSRWSLPIGQNIRVGPMRPDEAQQFLEMRRQQSKRPERLKEVDWGRVAEVAERNPMLMRWVVAQLEQAMRPQDVFDDIARGKGETIDRIFGRTFRLLGDDGQMALLALALFVPTASREALAAVCGFEDGKDRVNEAIRRLAAFDLLDTAVEGDRLGIVALARHLTQAQLERDERTEALKERFVAYFLAYAEAHPEVTKEDLDALGEERENLLAALDYAYAAEDWETVMRLAGEICTGATGLLAVRGYWDEALKWGERAAEAASQANLPSAAASFSTNVGIMQHRRGEYVEAREAYQKALSFFQQDRDERNVAVVLHQLGIVAQDKGHYGEANDLYNKSLEIFRDLGDQTGIASSLHELGIISYCQGNYEEAKRLYQKSLEISEQLGDQARIAKSLHQLGLIAQVQGDYQEAKDLCNQSLQINRNLGDQAGIAKSLHQLGIIAQLQGDYQEAKDLYNQSLEISTSLGDQAGISISLHQLGMLAHDQGDYQEAKDLYNQSLEIARTLEDPWLLAKSLHGLGIIARHEGRYQDAKDLYNQSLEISRDLEDHAGIAASLFQLGRVAEDEGKSDEAIRLFKQSLAIAEQLGVPEAEMIRQTLARVSKEKE